MDDPHVLPVTHLPGTDTLPVHIDQPTDTTSCLVDVARSPHGR
ncbi:hypothetical protein DVS28_b0184 (plasmid) [Euzebya pacifica]|uniref:Uncharacterized protein n=1 Tax=Euzebya pacifica TaxID=1608957 RepID=A0A346Y657_9ACTN|nr:hypothetical protein DVS28_b0184 [Euzebya pacifica]